MFESKACVVYILEIFGINPQLCIPLSLFDSGYHNFLPETLQLVSALATLIPLSSHCHQRDPCRNTYLVCYGSPNSFIIFSLFYNETRTLWLDTEDHLRLVFSQPLHHQSCPSPFFSQTPTALKCLPVLEGVHLVPEAFYLLVVLSPRKRQSQ